MYTLWCPLPSIQKGTTPNSKHQIFKRQKYFSYYPKSWVGQRSGSLVWFSHPISCKIISWNFLMYCREISHSHHTFTTFMWFTARIYSNSLTHPKHNEFLRFSINFILTQKSLRSECLYILSKQVRIMCNGINISWYYSTCEQTYNT